VGVTQEQVGLMLARMWMGLVEQDKASPKPCNDSGCIAFLASPGKVSHPASRGASQLTRERLADTEGLTKAFESLLRYVAACNKLSKVQHVLSNCLHRGEHIASATGAMPRLHVLRSLHLLLLHELEDWHRHLRLTSLLR
jgi:hypothetical protein